MVTHNLEPSDALLAVDVGNSRIGMAIWDDGPTGEHPVEMTEVGLLVDEVGEGEHQVSASFTCHLMFLPLAAKH